MATLVACPVPILTFTNNAGQPNVGGSILTQVGGVNAATYQDIGGTIPLPNPIPLNSRGEISNASGLSCQLFLTPNVVYTFTMFDANANQMNQALYVNGLQISFTQTGIGAILYPPTAAEAGVTIVNGWYPPLSVLRYGAVGDGTTNDVAAFNRAVTVASVSGGAVYVPGGHTYKCLTNVNVTGSGVRIYGDGLSSIVSFPDNVNRYSGFTFTGTAGTHLTSAQVDNIQIVGGGTYPGNTSGSGVLCNYVDNVRIFAVTSHEWSDNAFACGGAGGGANKWQLTDCIGYNIGQGVSMFYPSQNVEITDCIFHDISLYNGIDVEGTGGGTNGTATSGSTTTLADTTKTWIVNQFAGLPLSVTVGGTVYTSTVTSNTSNTLTFPAIGAAVVATDAYTVAAEGYAVVANNIVYNCTGPTNQAQGINIEIINNVTVTGNVVYNVLGGGAGNGNGIHLFGAGYTTVTGNTCYDNSGFGIYVGANSGNSTVVGNTTNSNTLGCLKLTDDATAASLSVLINNNNFNEGYITLSGSVSLRDPRNWTGPLTNDFGLTGTNTIAVVGTSTAGTCTYSIKVARYKLDAHDATCFISINLSWTGHTGTGNIQINGLPFASANYATFPLNVQSGVAVTSPNVLRAAVAQAGTTIGVSQESSAGVNTGVPISASGTLVFNGSYPLN